MISIFIFIKKYLNLFFNNKYLKLDKLLKNLFIQNGLFFFIGAYGF
jgi:hypothetical protein